MAILLPVRAESALTLPAATPPIPACKRAQGQGLQHHLQPLQCLLVTIHGHHSSQHRGFHLVHKNTNESQFFTLPLTYVCLSAGLWVSFAAWQDENCLIQLSFTWGLHHLQKLSLASHANQRNYCCSIMFFALSQVRGRLETKHSCACFCIPDLGTLSCSLDLRKSVGIFNSFYSAQEDELYL